MCVCQVSILPHSGFQPPNFGFPTSHEQVSNLPRTGFQPPTLIGHKASRKGSRKGVIYRHNLQPLTTSRRIATIRHSQADGTTQRRRLCRWGGTPDTRTSDQWLHRSPDSAAPARVSGLNLCVCFAQDLNSPTQPPRTATFAHSKHNSA